MECARSDKTGETRRNAVHMETATPVSTAETKYAHPRKRSDFHVKMISNAQIQLGAERESAHNTGHWRTTRNLIMHSYAKAAI